MFFRVLGVLLFATCLRCLLGEVVSEEGLGADTKASCTGRSIAVVRAIHRQYVEQCSSIPSDVDGKTRRAREGQILNRLLREHCARDGDEPIVSAFIGVGQSSCRLPDFGALEAELLMILAGDGKRELLTKMFSQRCPEWLDSGLSTELMLATVGEEALTDGIIVLCDAWERSKSEANRKTLLKILRRAFLPHVLPAPNDRAFVEACRTWYHAHQNRITVNDFYRSDGLDRTSPLFVVDETERD